MLIRALILVPPSKFTKNVPRDLVYGCWCKGKRIAGIQFPPLTSVMVATIIRADGGQADFLDAAAEGLTVQDVTRRAADYSLVGMLTSTMTVNEDAEFLNALKAGNPGLKTVVFGSHPTFLPKHTLAKPGIDIAARGEFDYIVRDLARAMLKGDDSWQSIPGISFRRDGQVVDNPAYPLIQNLDGMPFADRKLLPKGVDYFNPIVKRVPFTTSYTTRGCPGLCVYCSSPRFYGRKIRYRSAANIFEELKEITGMGYREVFFRDEFFPVKKSRTMELCDMILSAGMDLTWICSARVGSVDRESMIAMKKAGCHMIRFGVESGSQAVLDKVKKGITLEETRETFRWIHEVGLDTHAHMMIGMPGETAETIEQSIRFAIEIDPTIVTFGITTPYAGTDIYDELAATHPEIGDASECDLSRLHTQGFFNQHFCDLDGPQLSDAVKRAYRKFYLRPSYMLRWLMRIKSADELRRVTLAGTKVFDFAIRGE
ncbi:MAG TPA: radical SAM protein [Candidatus Brocadiia bacterium]|nr:radical SAM protein [Candidatus Brocadiia bacterium]